MHPLTSDLSKLTDDELQQKRGELQNRLMMSYRMGNADLVMQVQLLLGDYDMELQARNQKMMDQMSKASKNFGNIINISR
jgi:hypothetical protein